MTPVSNGGTKTERHHATAKAWEWLERGDGRKLDRVQKARIRVRLREMDELLLSIDRERSGV